MITLMIVDDSRFMRSLIRGYVNGYCDVIGEADNGLSAVELYKKCKPDIVTLDITMDRMSGLEALKEIIKYDSNARVIICSAMGQKPLIDEAIENGAKGYIVKPFQKHNVLRAISNAL